MHSESEIDTFLSTYPQTVVTITQRLRAFLKNELPDITEQYDLPARMVAYVYGQKYADMICTIIPSKKGVKLGFYKGTEISDPEGMLQGSGKITRYVQFNTADQFPAEYLRRLLSDALKNYRQRSSDK